MPFGRGNSPTRVSRPRSRSPRRSRSPVRRGSGRDVRGKECRVYVINLSYDVKWMHLKDIMKKHGTVEHVEIFTDNTGRSKGSGVVEFAHAEDAARAMKELDGHELQGRKMRLREDKMDDDKYIEQLKTQKEKSRVHKEQSRNQSYNSGQSQMGPGGGGLGQVGNSLGGAGGIGSLLGGGHVQLIQLLNSKGGDPSNSSIFVSNLDYDVTWQKLKDMFQRAGNCMRCDLAQDDDKRSRGFGSAQFETPFEALTAIAMFNGLELGHRGRQMSLRLDRDSALLQVLEQLGVPSNEITEKTITQLQSIATLSSLASAGGGLGGLGALSQLTALTSGNTYQSLQTNPSSAGGSSALSSLSSLGALGGLGTLLSSGLGSTLSTLLGASASAGSNLASGNYGSSSQYDSRDSYSERNQSNSRDSGGRYTSSRTDSRSGPRDTPRAPPGCRVFVRNLPFSIRWQDLKDRFREAGRISHADVKLNDDGRSKGCGTVTFESSQDADRAVSLFNRCQLDGREIEVRIDQMN